MKKVKPRTIALTTIVVAVAIQFVPIQHDNPPETQPLSGAPPPVTAILNRACADCHSHATEWPWYSYVAPVSWLVSRDVHDGREHLNFSEWGGYSPALRLKKLAGISGEVQKGEMPLWFYLPMHPAARLSEDDVMVLSTWADNASGTEGTR